MMKAIGSRFLLAIGLLLLLVACDDLPLSSYPLQSACRSPQDCGLTPPTRLQDVRRLTQILPQLAKYRVLDYRHQDWCKNINYQGGKYSDNIKATTCNLFDGQPQPMSEKAWQDFQSIAAIIAKTGVNIHFLSIRYDKGDRPIEANFQLATSCRCAYTYQPKYSQLPAGMPSKMEYAKIDADWYFSWED